MALPTKKMYNRKGELIFDPNNPEDVKNYKEKQPLIEALKLVQGLTDPRGGAGLTGMARVINRAVGAKMAKSKFTQNKAKQVLDLVTKPMTRGKKAATKTTPAIKEIVETKPAIPTTIPSTTSTTSNRIKSLSKDEIKAFETVKNIRELAEKQIKNTPTTVSSAKELWKKPLPTPSYTEDGFRIGGTEAKSILSNLKDKEAARKAAKEAYEKSKATIIKQGIEESNRKIVDKAISIGAISGLIGGGTAATYYGIQQPTKNNKQTTTPQKTSPVDLKRIDKNKLKDSATEGVKIIKGSDGKDYGIVWNNTTESWDYYRGDKNKKTNEPTVVKKEDNKGSGTNTGSRTGGGRTTPRTTTVPTAPVKPDVTPTTKTYVGNEYAKANPDVEKAMEEDSIRQQRKMYIEKMSKPLSSLVFKTTSKAVDVRNVMDEQDALRSIRENNKLPLKKKRYGGNLTMLKYMK